MRKARAIRQFRPAVYHCTSRVVGGAFLLGLQEKEHMRRLIRHQAKFSGVKIVNFNVMTNHFHVVVLVDFPTRNLTDAQLFKRVRDYYGKKHPQTLFLAQCLEEMGYIPKDLRQRYLSRMGDLSIYMKELKQRFTIWYNHQHDRYGTLWAERFKSQDFEPKPSLLMTLCAYVDLNSVRARLTPDPKDYRFCGYAEAVAGSRLARDGLALCFPGMSWKEMNAEYRSYMMVKGGVPGHSDKAELSPEKIREVLKAGGKLDEGQLLRLRIRYFIDGLTLGSREYVEETFQTFRHLFGPKRRSGARKLKLPGFKDLCVARDLRRNPVE